MPDRPNILWLTYEDTSPQFVSCYGETPVVTSPTIDGLAEDGVRCDRVFATSPVCSASRSAIITGVCNEATGLGHHRSKYPIPRDRIKGFPYYLQQAGYYTTNNNKTDYNIEEEADFIAETWHASSPAAHWRNRAAGQPFFSVFNFMDSHQSRTMTKPWGWYEEQVLGELTEAEAILPDDVAMPPIYLDNAEMRRHLSRVYNSVKLCDAHIGQRLDELAADGLLDDTIIFCFADHGEGIPRGKCNGIGFGYRTAFVLWFPEKWKHLSPWGTQVVTDELISFEDLAPTVLSLAGIPVPDHLTGRAFLGEQRQEPPACIFAARNRLDDTPDLVRSAMDKRFVYTRNFFPHLPVCKYQKYSDVGDILRVIRRDYAAGELNDIQAELVQPTRPVEYLYDLSVDSWETRNLAGDPTYLADLQRLRQATLDHARQIHDVMFLPEREMVDRARPGSPYVRRAETAYNPLEDMLRLAQLVGDPAAVPEQLAALEHDDAAVRYWAAVGLYANRDQLPPHTDALRKHLQDPSPIVVTELAAAIYPTTRDPQARQLLGELIEAEDELIAHQAIQKVLYMPAVAADFAPFVDQACQRLNEAGTASRTFPVQQSCDMFRYLYQGQPLLYAEDASYFADSETRSAPWR